MVSQVHFLEAGLGWRVKLLLHFLYSRQVFGSPDVGKPSPLFGYLPKKHHGCKKRQHRAANWT